MKSLKLLAAAATSENDIKYKSNELDSQSAEIVELYKNNENNWTKVLNYACEKGFLDIVKLIFKEDETTITSENKALELAAQNGFLEIVQFLISEARRAKKCEASLIPQINAKDLYKAHKLATQNSHLAVAEYIIKEISPEEEQEFSRFDTEAFAENMRNSKSDDIDHVFARNYHFLRFFKLIEYINSPNISKDEKLQYEWELKVFHDFNI